MNKKNPLEGNDCQCVDLPTTKKKCVICNRLHLATSNNWDKHGNCHLHEHLAITICGFPEPVCNQCKQEGWYSTAGTGGGTHRLNDKLNLKLVNGKIVKQVS